MFSVLFKEGINQPRVLGNFSVLRSAQELVVSHSTAHGGKLKATKQEGVWLAQGQDRTYLIQSGIELPNHKK